MDAEAPTILDSLDHLDYAAFGPSELHNTGPMGVTLPQAGLILAGVSVAVLLLMPMAICYMSFMTNRERSRWRREEKANATRLRVMERAEKARHKEEQEQAERVEAAAALHQNRAEPAVRRGRAVARAGDMQHSEHRASASSKSHNRAGDIRRQSADSVAARAQEARREARHEARRRKRGEEGQREERWRG